MRILAVLFCFFTLQSHAQLDPSASVLVGSGSSSPASGLQSGRYASDLPGTAEEDKDAAPVKAEPVVKASAGKKIVRKKTGKPGEIPMAVIEPKVRRWITSNTQEAVTVSAPAPAPAPEAIQTPAVTPAPVNSPEAPPKEAASVPGPATQANQAEVEDVPDFERIQIEILTGIMHADAASNSVYRSLSMTSPILGLGGEVWLNEGMGFSGRYQSTLSADISSATSLVARVPVTREWSELRWNFRAPITSRNGMFLQYGLVYFEDSLKAPSDELSRVSLRSSGLGGALGFNIPHSKSYSSTVNAALYPRISHQESATGLNLASGSSPNSTRLDLAWGGNLRLAQAKILFWSLGLQLEKNQFDGESNTLEPSGVAAENVSVLTNTVFFQLGYRWGR